MVLEVAIIAKEYGRLPSEIMEAYTGVVLEGWERYALDRSALIAIKDLERTVAGKGPREVSPAEFERLKRRYMEVRKRG